MFMILFVFVILL